MVYSKLRSYLKNIYLIFIILLFPPIAHAADVDVSQFKDAAINLRDVTFNNCKYSFEFTESLEINGSLRSTKKNGTLVFARSGSAFFSDRSVVSSSRVSSDGQRPLRDESVNLQYSMSEGKRCLGIRYTPTKSGRKVDSVYCDPRHTFDDSLLFLCRNVQLDDILVAFGPTGVGIGELTQNQTVSVQPKNNGNVVATYATSYGSVEVELFTANGKDQISAVRISQGGGDVYTSEAKGTCLSDVRDSVLGDTPQGLTAATTEITISYDKPHGRSPLTAIQRVHSISAAGKHRKITQKLRVTGYEERKGEAEIEALRVIIPDGELVDSLDPAYKSLTLAYRGGQVVRQVDGTTLEHVIAEDKTRQTVATALTFGFGLLALLVSGVLIWRWTKRRRRGNGVAT